MTDPLTAWSRSQLLAAMSLDSAAHMTKRLAHIDREGHPPASLLNDPRHKFVLEARNRLSRVEGSFRQAAQMILQVHHTPPAEWLKTVVLTPEQFAQQALDHFTLVLYSALDRCLLLANHVMSLGIHDRLATYKTVQKEMKAKDHAVSLAFADLYKATEPLSDPRHFFAHRGESREVPLFTKLVRTKAIVSAWGAPTAGVVFADQEARAHLLSLMAKDIHTVTRAAVASCDTLLGHYQRQLASLGGADLPTDEEKTRAAAAAKYFEGGERPSFMNGSS